MEITSNGNLDKKKETYRHIDTVSQSVIHSVSHLFIHSFSHSIIYSVSQSIIQSFIQSVNLNHLYSQSVVPPCVHLGRVHLALRGKIKGRPDKTWRAGRGVGNSSLRLATAANLEPQKYRCLNSTYISFYLSLFLSH